MLDWQRVREELERLCGTELEGSGCGCCHRFVDDTLVVDATECPGGGRLTQMPACRATVVTALSRRDARSIRVEASGVERLYDGRGASFLAAAGCFVADCPDERLTARARRDPLAAAREATGRADRAATLATETAFTVHLDQFEDLVDMGETGLRGPEVESQARYRELLAPTVTPAISHWRVERMPPSDSELVSVTDLSSGTTVRRYRTGSGLDRYQFDPPSSRLPDGSLAVLERAYELLAAGRFDALERAPARAVRSALQTLDHGSNPREDIPPENLIATLEKHTTGHGHLEECFADPRVSDVFVTAPASQNPVRLRLDGELLETNLWLTEDGVEALASRFRRESGRAFSRADPTLDARTTIADRRVRVAGVTDPTSEGTAFAFRAHDRTAWTLGRLLANGTVTADVAGLLSVAVERGRSLLVAGPRGAGKTTMLGALLWELPATTRTLAIEDTPELPVAALQAAGRDVQALRTSEESQELSVAEALRTALRLGDGALVLGEVRGEEAAVLYEAMRVGANSEAVLGTIHGDGGAAVRERVVTDLGVAPTSFTETDLVVTLERTSDGQRRIALVEEVHDDGTPPFSALYARDGETLAPTGRIDRGNSHLLAAMTSPGESYAAIRECVGDRSRLVSALADGSDGKRTRATRRPMPGPS